MAEPSQRRVLLVDDDEGVVSTVQFALERQSYTVIVARDGTEALKLLELHRPQLVILDAVMPHRSGVIVLEHLCKLQAPPPIIMMSGQNDDRLREFALSCGVRAFLDKPFDIDDLLARVVELLPAP